MKFVSAVAIASCVCTPAIVSSPVPEAEKRAHFYLVPQVIKGPSKFNRGYVNPFHTGAGENAVVIEPKTGTEFYINESSIQIAGARSLHFTIGLNHFTPFNSTAPDDYFYVI